MVKGLNVVCATVALLALTACEGHDESGAPTTSETREVGEFKAVEMEGAARLVITVGPAAAVSIEAQPEALKRITTEVRDGALYIRNKPRDWLVTDGSPRVTVKISTPQLETLTVQGGNDVRVQGYDGGAVRIRAEGAARIDAQGRVDELTVQLAGAGHADLTNLVAQRANVTVDGVGSVYVHPQEALDATMNGVGAILYTGNPREVSTHMNGLGTIGRRDGNDKPEPAKDAEQNAEVERAEPERRESRKPAVDSTEVI